MKKSFLLVVLSAACAAQTQSLKMIGVRFAANGSTPNTIKFLCSQKYDHVDCVKNAIALRQAMAPYPMQTLGAWSFVLVTAEWQHSRMQQDSGAEADQSGDKCPGRRRHRLSTIEEVSPRQL